MKFYFSLCFLIFFCLYAIDVDCQIDCNAAKIGASIRKDKISDIEKNFRASIAIQNDSCILSYVDSAFGNYMHSNSQRDFEIITALSCHFDGFIAEYVVDKFYSLFEDENSRNDFLRKLFIANKQSANKKLCLKDVTQLFLTAYKPPFTAVIKNTKPTDEYKKFLISLISY